MTKISLVQLSQMKNKPHKIYRIYKSGKKELYLFDGNNYRNEDEGEILFFNLCDFNEPLIEIIEDQILTDEEKEFLKALIKISLINYVDSVRIEYVGEIYHLILLNGITRNDIKIKDNVFKGLEIDETYTLEELGLYDEE